MIQSVTIENFLGESVECVLNNPFGHGLNITDIQGLGPGSTNVVTQDLALIDGSVYTSTRRPQRNIVITYKFIEAEDIEDVRHRTIDLFGLGRYVKMTFHTDHRTLWIDGYVESNEPDIFSSGETTQVSIICPDPWFRSQSVLKTDILDYVDTNPWGFEFILDKGREKDDMIEFAQVSEAKQREARSGVLPRQYRIFNPGDRDMGFILTLTAKNPQLLDNPDPKNPEGVAPDNFKFKKDENGYWYSDESEYVQLPYAGLTHFYVSNKTNGEMAHICLEQSMRFQGGESYVFRSIPGYKMAFMHKYVDTKDHTQGMRYIPALSEFDRNLDWVKLRKGENILVVNPYCIPNYVPGSKAMGGYDMTNRFNMTIEFDPLYEGV